MRNFEHPGRSLAVGRKGMAATSHSLATLAAIEALRDGGNSLDAAVTACAVQCVVEAGSTGIGGDCFALLSRRGSPDVVAYNGSGRTPLAAGFALLEEGSSRLQPAMARPRVMRCPRLPPLNRRLSPTC